VPAESAGRPTLDVQSFRVVFALERRIHRIDRWRLPLPYGVPVRALGYGAAVLGAVIAMSRLPLTGALLAVLPAPIRFVLLPGLAAFALDRTRVDGRPAHSHLIALVRHRLRRRHLSGLRPAPAPGHEDRVLDDIYFVPDEQARVYRAARVRGPAKLRLAYPVVGKRRHGRLILHQASTQPLRCTRLLRVGPGAEVEFR
jgi:hypothetical protein